MFDYSKFAGRILRRKGYSVKCKAEGNAIVSCTGVEIAWGYDDKMICKVFGDERDQIAILSDKVDAIYERLID